MTLRQSLLAAVPAVAVLFVLLAAFGPPLPGPNLRDLVGLESSSAAEPCTPDPKRVLSPRSPPPAAGRWRAEPPAPEAHPELQAAVAGGVVYLVGGQGGTGGRGDTVATVITYDPATRRYGRGRDMPQPADHALVTAYAGDVYVVGGYVNAEPTDRVWRYSPRDDRWSEMPRLPVARGGLSGGVVGDRLYAVGGAPRTYPEVYAKPYGNVDVLDMRSRRWSAGPPLPTPRHHLAAAALDGSLYVVGGRAPDDFSLDAVERLDPRRGVWERLPPLPLGVGGPDVAVARGELVVTGGDEEEKWERGRGWVTPAAWAFDPRRNRWRRLPDLRQPRHAHAEVVAGGRLWVFEGSPCAGFSRTASVESLSLGR